jgi:hypothetical protein
MKNQILFPSIFLVGITLFSSFSLNQKDVNLISNFEIWGGNQVNLKCYDVPPNQQSGPYFKRRCTDNQDSFFCDFDNIFHITETGQCVIIQE